MLVSFTATGGEFKRGVVLLIKIVPLLVTMPFTEKLNHLGYLLTADEAIHE